MSKKTETETTSILRSMADEEIKAGGEVFMGWPDRWYEKPGPKWRCSSDHVSTRLLKSEAKGGNVCLSCFEFVTITFPEDADGPLAIVITGRAGTT